MRTFGLVALPLFLAGSPVVASAQEVIDFSALPTGAVVSEVFGSLGSGPVRVYGFNPRLRGFNTAVIFDSANPTGDDPDLATPTNGKVLILAEDLVDGNGDGLVDDPDDEDGGGLLIFDFQTHVGPVTVTSMTIIDNEPTEGAAVVWLDATGQSIGDTLLPTTPDGGLSNVAFGSISDVSYMIVAFAGSAAIDDLEFQAATECTPCQGKVDELTLQYVGSTVSAHVEVTQKDGDVVFEGIVQPGDRFTFEGTDKHDTLGTEITIKVNGVVNAKIHTSCSQPIGPGLEAGDFRVIGGTSREGGQLCPLGDPGDQLCGSGFKAQVLKMKYTGQSCAASSSSQDPKKLTCEGDPGADPSVFVVASSKADPTDPKAKTWFAGNVGLGETFQIDARNGGANTLKADTFVVIYDSPGGELLQFLRFHTSCSQPLELNDQFGGLRLEDLLAVPK